MSGFSNGAVSAQQVRIRCMDDLDCEQPLTSRGRFDKRGFVIHAETHCMGTMFPLGLQTSGMVKSVTDALETLHWIQYQQASLSRDGH